MNGNDETLAEKATPTPQKSFTLKDIGQQLKL
jgi:hypothetical protein